MKVGFKKSFARDLKNYKHDKNLMEQVGMAIKDVEKATALIEIKSLKKLKGDGGYYRIRIGNYRIGLKLEDDTLNFVRCLHRRDIYRYFPPR